MMGEAQLTQRKLVRARAGLDVIWIGLIALAYFLVARFSLTLMFESAES